MKNLVFKMGDKEMSRTFLLLNVETQERIAWASDFSGGGEVQCNHLKLEELRWAVLSAILYFNAKTRRHNRVQFQNTTFL